MFCTVNSFGLEGIDGYVVRAEVNTSRGLPAFDIVGLPDAAVRESRDRVRAAFYNNQIGFPKGRIIVNLAPAGTKKIGSVYDLSIFMGILLCEGGLSANLDDCAFVGELSLSGHVRRITGVLPMALSAKALGIKHLFVPAENAKEAANARGISVYGVSDVLSLLLHFKGEKPLEPVLPDPPGSAPDEFSVDFSEVKGQQEAKRALEIAAAGGHSVLMLGSPGSGKSMLAKRLPTILPPLDYEEAIVVTKIRSVAGLIAPGEGLVRERPFRAPHHTVSTVGLTGGGSSPKPGEISLAHGGVLFLDELPEFPRPVTEVLRQPLEDGEVTISRVGARVTYPSRFTVVAAMNPCPCGYFGHPTKECTCGAPAVARYLGRVSGPLLDRLDLQIEVNPAEYASLRSSDKEESSASIRARVVAARNLQAERYKNEGFATNSSMTPGKLRHYCALTPAAERLLKLAFERLSLSGRAHDRLLKTARTIADLEGAQNILDSHISEAVSYRSIDRKYWG